MHLPLHCPGALPRVVLVSLLLAGAAVLPAAEVPLQLPDVSVTDTRPPPVPESWQYARLEDGTEVLSNASERATRRLLRDFQIFQQALEVVWPLPPPAQPPARALILCGRRDKFADFATLDDSSSDTSSASLFLRNREQAAIIVDLQASVITLNGQGDEAGNATSDFAVDPHRQLYREYVRYLLSQGETPPPPWMQEGMAQIIMAMQFSPTWIIFGRVDASSTADPASAGLAGETAAASGASASVGLEMNNAPLDDPPFTLTLRNRALMPLDQFFAVTADSREARNAVGGNAWAKQAYAFVHLCLFGERGRYKEAYQQFTRRLAREPLSEALFKECFKMSYKDMIAELRGYIGFTHYTSTTYQLKRGAKPLGGDPVVLRDATDAEVGRLKGDAQMLAGRTREALTTYHDTYVRGAREPAFLGAYGVAESRLGGSERARTSLETAAQATVRRPAVYIELARLRLREAQAKPAAPAGRLAPAQVNAVLEPLLKARQLEPTLAETYELVGKTWLAGAGLPPKDHLAVLTEGIQRFPRAAGLYHALAAIYQRAGDTATAAKVARAGLALGTDEAGRARLQQLLASLPSPPASR